MWPITDGIVAMEVEHDGDRYLRTPASLLPKKSDMTKCTAIQTYLLLHAYHARPFLHQKPIAFLTQIR